MPRLFARVPVLSVCAIVGSGARRVTRRVSCSRVLAVLAGVGPLFLECLEGTSRVPRVILYCVLECLDLLWTREEL